MTDKLNKKVIDIFSKNKKSGTCNSSRVCKTSDDYLYVTIKKDENGRSFDEKTLLKKADKFYYIVKILIKDSPHPYINNFKIPGDKIIDFIKMYADENGEGQIIEIDKFYPEEWA